MSDLCACGHEEREHVRVTAFGIVVCCGVVRSPNPTAMVSPCNCTAFTPRKDDDAARILRAVRP